MTVDNNQPIEELSYDEAIAEAEQLLSGLESNKLPIDQVLSMSRRVTALIKHCKMKIKEVGTEVDSILKELDDAISSEATPQN